MDGIGNITQTVLYFKTLPWVRQKPGAMDCEACICDDCVAAIGAEQPRRNAVRTNREPPSALCHPAAAGHGRLRPDRSLRARGDSERGERSLIWATFVRDFARSGVPRHHV